MKQQMKKSEKINICNKTSRGTSVEYDKGRVQKLKSQADPRKRFKCKPKSAVTGNYITFVVIPFF